MIFYHLLEVIVDQLLLNHQFHIKKNIIEIEIDPNLIEEDQEDQDLIIGIIIVSLVTMIEIDINKIIIKGKGKVAGIIGIHMIEILIIEIEKEKEKEVAKEDTIKNLQKIKKKNQNLALLVLIQVVVHHLLHLLELCFIIIIFLYLIIF